MDPVPHNTMPDPGVPHYLGPQLYNQSTATYPSRTVLVADCTLCGKFLQDDLVQVNFDLIVSCTHQVARLQGTLSGNG